MSIELPRRYEDYEALEEDLGLNRTRAVCVSLQGANGFGHSRNVYKREDNSHEMDVIYMLHKGREGVASKMQWWNLCRRPNRPNITMGLW